MRPLAWALINLRIQNDKVRMEQGTIMPYRAFDHIKVRCPRLGGEVPFGYCRCLKDGLPCQRALVCFERKFPAVKYFRLILKEETFSQIFHAESPSRIETFFETIRKAKERAGEAIRVRS